MRSVVLRSASLAGAVVAAVLGVYLLLPQSRSAVMAALIDKEMLLQATPGPRIIFVGGSSAAFGIDSDRVHQAFSPRYAGVVNTGLHGGLGLRFMLDFVRPYLKAGDLVVLAPEYSLLNDLHDDRTALNSALAEYPPLWRYVSSADGLEPGTILRTVQHRARRTLGLVSESVEPVYTRSGFNAHGDLVSHLGRVPDAALNPVPLTFMTPAETALRILNTFYEACGTQGVSVVLTFAPYPRELHNASGLPGWLDHFKARTPIPVISKPGDYLLGLHLFFDTVYHLNAEGRQVRTTRLIADLQRALKLTL